jgi:hypothetical protein
MQYFQIISMADDAHHTPIVIQDGEVVDVVGAENLIYPLHGVVGMQEINIAGHDAGDSGSSVNHDSSF